MNMKERLKSWPVWLSVLGNIALILTALGLFDRWGIDSARWEIIVTAVGSILVTFGILNNPTDRHNF